MRMTLAAVLVASAAVSETCEGYGPQTPRDIASAEGTNARLFSIAPPASEMNLCNIHSHTQAEHKGPGFMVFAGDDDHGGWRCNGTEDLTEAELAMPEEELTYDHVVPGDTIEVHWVHTSCDVTPGEGLGSCLSDACGNPQLRVEAQVFLVVNDPEAPSFLDYAYAGNVVNGLHQALAIPEGEAVEFTGSTTGPSYTEATCSPLQVTWNVRTQCQKISIQSLNAWGQDNVFNENKSHGVRQLVTERVLLSPIMN